MQRPVNCFYSVFQARMKATGELAAVKIIHIEPGVFRNSFQFDSFYVQVLYFRFSCLFLSFSILNLFLYSFLLVAILKLLRTEKRHFHLLYFV